MVWRSRGTAGGGEGLRSAEQEDRAVPVDTIVTGRPVVLGRSGRFEALLPLVNPTP